VRSRIRQIERISEMVSTLSDPRTKVIVSDVMRSTLQRVGAHAVDRAIWHLGLGRQGTRLTGTSLKASTDRWEAEVTGFKPSTVAEAAELITQRALSAVFDIDGGETIALESLNIRWLQSSAPERERADGTVFLEWNLSEREEFRREALTHLTSGAVAYLTAFGCDRAGLAIVQIELEVRASMRRQMAGAQHEGAKP
jgi:hypothetical protein